MQDGAKNSHALGSCSLNKHNHHIRQCGIVSLEIEKKSK